jgi:hypothetical protein
VPGGKHKERCRWEKRPGLVDVACKVYCGVESQFVGQVLQSCLRTLGRGFSGMVIPLNLSIYLELMRIIPEERVVSQFGMRGLLGLSLERCLVLYCFFHRCRYNLGAYVNWKSTPVRLELLHP